MRDSNRLDNFYEKIKEIHKETFPDWRFGQLMYNFITWLNTYKKVDCFFPEENRMIEYLNEYKEWIAT